MQVFDSMSAGLIAHMDKEENVYWPRLQAKMPIQDQEVRALGLVRPVPPSLRHVDA